MLSSDDVPMVQPYKAIVTSRNNENLSRPGLLCLLFLGCISVSFGVYVITKTPLQNGYAIAAGIAGIAMLLIFGHQWARAGKR
jgi:hypothetical protein